MKFLYAAALLGLVPAFGPTRDAQSPRELEASQLADRLYGFFLDTKMPVDDTFDDIRFRISNDLWHGNHPKVPEFYLSARIRAQFVKVSFAPTASIYSPLYEHLLAKPRSTSAAFEFSPPLVHKEFTYDQCPGLRPRILAVEEFIRTSLFADRQITRSKSSGLAYDIAYGVAPFDLKFKTDKADVHPVVDLIEIRDLVLECARKLPTVQEEQEARELASKQAHEEFLRNFKGPLVYSPPAIVARVGGRKYESALGSYCWGLGGEDFCDDKFAVVTPARRIVVHRGDALAFEFPLHDWLESVDFAITPVTAANLSQDEIHRKIRGLRFWSAEPEELPMSPAQRDALVIDQPAGEYLFTLTADWREYGNVCHGFHLEVIEP